MRDFVKSYDFLCETNIHSPIFIVVIEQDESV